MHSLESDPPVVRNPAPASPSAAQKKASASLWGTLGQLYTAQEEEESSEDEEKEATLVPGFRPPGGVVPPKKPKSKPAAPALDITGLIGHAMTTGAPLSDLTPLLLLDFMQKQGANRGHGRGGSSSGGGSVAESSSGEENESGMLKSGMKAIRNIEKMRSRVYKDPTGIVKRFESEIQRELGIVPGAPWMVLDWIRKLQWGKFKGIYRTAVMDVAVYELLRQNKKGEALAQLVQNLKAKRQCVLQQGERSTAWLLTGLQDPLESKHFAGEAVEMATVAAYTKALRELRTRVSNAPTSHHDEGHHGAEDQEQTGKGRRKGKKDKKKDEKDP